MTNINEVAEAVLNIHTQLSSVLCDPEGRPCIHGSAADLNVIDDALRQLYDISNTAAIEAMTKPTDKE